MLFYILNEYFLEMYDYIVLIFNIFINLAF